MRMNNLFLVLPIALVLLVSGCSIFPSGGSGGSYGNGLVIEAFEPDIQGVFQGEPFKLRLQLRNTGSIPATVAALSVTGLEELGTPGITCTPDKSSSLLAPDPVQGTTGGAMVCITGEYKYDKVIEKGQGITLNPSTRIHYNYGSNSIKSVTFVPQAEMRRLQDSGGALPLDTISKSSGPITIDIVTKGPIRVFGSDVKFPIEINVRNVGGGTACLTDCDNSEEWNKVKIDTEIGVLNIGECSKELQIWKGQSATIVCEYTETGGSGLTAPLQKRITVESNYQYLIDKTIPVTITGRGS